MVIGGCGSHQALIDDPVEGIPLSHQTTISRAGFGFRWPLSVGGGTLACDDRGAILFRARSVTYAVSGARTGALDIAPLRIPAPSAPPSNPLKRIKQTQRMEAFASMLACESHNRDEMCRRTTLARFGLSNDD